MIFFSRYFSVIRDTLIFNVTNHYHDFKRQQHTTTTTITFLHNNIHLKVVQQLGDINTTLTTLTTMGNKGEEIKDIELTQQQQQQHTQQHK